MRKLISLVCLATATSMFISSYDASAQISEGMPTSRTIRTGNRPEAGTWGLYMGATSNIFKACFDGFQVTALPLVNFKYMSTDNFEWRCGLELIRTGKSVDGTVSSSTYSTKDVTDGKALFYPGFAYHFSSKNIFDVYLGAELPIGFIYSQSKNTISSASYSVSQNKFNLGVGAFLGFQVFIANLPLALGLEYGISFNAIIGDKTKYVATDESGRSTTTYYKTSLAPSSTEFSKLSASSSEFGNQLRLTLAYYFK